MQRYPVVFLGIGAFVAVVVAGCSSPSPAAPDLATAPPQLAASSGSSSTAIAAHEAAPVRNDALHIIPEYGRSNGTHLSPADLATDANTPLYRVANGAGAPIGPFPIFAPDGHQLTLKEYVNLSGSAAVKCINEGTHAVIHVSGLIPYGVYTLWYVVPNAAPPPLFLMVGPAGTDDGSQNRFDASASGEGELSTITPAGHFVFIPGNFPSCALTLREFHLVGAYHIDQRTWGPNPGNGGGTVIDSFAFIYRQ
ncbi:MAG: hypothetical protein V7647_3161 [Acidobacteriota bacterium]|jgi:hypothetical protein